MKQLTTFKTRAEADALTALLGKEKIPFFVLAGTGVSAQQDSSAGGGVQIMVNDDDFARAEKLVK